MTEELVQKLLNGQALETEEFCDFSLADQNEATGKFSICLLYMLFFLISSISRQAFMRP